MFTLKGPQHHVETGSIHGNLNPIGKLTKVVSHVNDEPYSGDLHKYFLGYDMCKKRSKHLLY